MLTYTVELFQGNSHSMQTVLHIEGAVTANDWEKMNRVSFDALNNCEHLAVNIEKITRFDCSFLFHICAIRMTAQLLGKEVTVEGNIPGSAICASEYELNSQAAPCRMPLSLPCYLWESFSGPGPNPLLNCWQAIPPAAVEENS